MANQFTSNEKWRQLGDDPQITDYIKNFGEKAFQEKYTPGREKYGHDLVGDPLKNIEEETGDTVAYISMAKAQQLEFIQQCNASRHILEHLLGTLTIECDVDLELLVHTYVPLILDHFESHVDLRETYPTD